MPRRSMIWVLTAVLAVGITGCTTTPTKSVDQPTTPAPTVSDPAPTPPEPQQAVVSGQPGELIEAGGVRLGVAGGRIVKVKGTQYLALRIYAKNVADDSGVGFTAGDLKLRDGSGELYEQNTTASIENSVDRVHGNDKMPDYSAYPLSDAGNQAAGWTLWPISTPSSDLVLVYERAWTASGPLAEISLDGVTKVPKTSQAAKAAALTNEYGN